MAQKPITNRIEFGQNLNPLNDYAGVPAINDDENLQTLIDKVDKVSFGKQVKLMLKLDICQTFYQSHDKI